jgi:hypothetical protein
MPCDYQGQRSTPGPPAVLATVAWGAASRRDFDRVVRDAHDALDRADPQGRDALRALHVLTETALLEGRVDDCIELAGCWWAAGARLGEDYDCARAGVDLVLAHLYAGDPEAARAPAVPHERPGQGPSPDPADSPPM